MPTVNNEKFIASLMSHRNLLMSGVEAIDNLLKIYTADNVVPVNNVIEDTATWEDVEKYILLHAGSGDWFTPAQMEKHLLEKYNIKVPRWKLLYRLKKMARNNELIFERPMKTKVKYKLQMA